MHITLSRSVLRLAKMASSLKPKRLKISCDADDSYFESYADITVHEEMLGDEIRTQAYKKAIFALGKAVDLKNKVVLDVGAGTGILSCFCAQAGAKKVYAVEASSIVEQAKKVCAYTRMRFLSLCSKTGCFNQISDSRELLKLCIHYSPAVKSFLQVVLSNGLESQIDVIKGLMEDVTLPEKVDVIVSEWMGYCLLYESMLSSVIMARDRWLKSDGIILPSAASLYIVPVCDDEEVVERVNFWNDMEDVYGLDMSCMLPFARSSLSKEQWRSLLKLSKCVVTFAAAFYSRTAKVMVKTISCENVLSKPQLVSYFNLLKVTQQDIDLVKYDFSFNSFGIADFQGFAVWFDVFFPFNPATKKNNLSHEPDDRMMSDNADSTGQSCNTEDETFEGSHLTHPEVPHSKYEVMPKSNDQNKSLATHRPLLLSTSPYKPETHWKQSILYLDNEIPVKQDTQIKGSICFRPSTKNRRFLNINMTCQVDNNECIEKNYFMGYELPNNETS